MTQGQSSPSGPDLSQGVPLTAFKDNKLLGHVGDKDVLLVRVGEEIFAVGAACSHYHGPLAEGLVEGTRIRCPWHHACFDLRSGEALRAPAFDPLPCWDIEQRGTLVFVGDKREKAKAVRPPSSAEPGSIVIVGGGAAGFAAAEMLRRRGYGGRVVMLSSDPAPPVDRPNLSKDYLAGSAPEQWLPLRSQRYYDKAEIDLRLATEVVAIDARARQVSTKGEDVFQYDRLLLATGAEPVSLTVPGGDQAHVHTLRSLDDCRSVIEGAKDARRALVVGASFIGLEVAAALRTRQIEVHVVAPGKRPMERVLGRELGDFVRKLHEEHGVMFHLEDTVVAIDGPRARLRSGEALDADLVVVGIGVRPRLALAEQIGLAIDKEVVVDAYLETSHAGIYAAGDIARWPDPHSGQSIRVEHWVVAERQGQVAALNMLGHRQRFDSAPFFWSQHYDVQINYVGHADHWDETIIDGDVMARDCLLRYVRDGAVLAAASISRDMQNLDEEMRMERKA